MSTAELLWVSFGIVACGLGSVFSVIGIARYLRSFFRGASGQTGRDMPFWIALASAIVLAAVWAVYAMHPAYR